MIRSPSSGHHAELNFEYLFNLAFYTSGERREVMGLVTVKETVIEPVTLL